MFKVLLLLLLYGYPRNPQTESYLQLLELPYLLDSMPEPKDVSYSPAAFIQRGSFSDDSETIPIDDVDELEELAEVDNEEAKE
ncbi:hypothetical protein CFP56_029882 [Quercus suber]|uniref:Uncharacterized protein n=1 Tax=Quercus suber TaxID=58331 RepID=A0AAW0JQ36_QUESU